MKSLRVALLALIAVGAAPEDAVVAIKGARVIPVSGPELESATIIVRGGKIEAVGKDLEIPWDARVIDGTRKVVIPGLVEAHTSRGTDRPNERLASVPFVSTFDSLNPVDPYFEDCLRQGITTLCVMPGNDTMIGGQGCIVRPTGVTTESMMVVKNAGMKLSLKPKAGVSRMAHMAALRKELSEAAEQLKDKKAEADPRREPMSKLLKGLLPAYVYCPTASDVHRAIELADASGLKLKLVLGRDGWKAAAEIAKKNLEAILDPELEYWETDESRHDDVRRFGAEAPAKAGVKIALQTDGQTYGSSYLWYQAAVAVRNGLTRAEALRAITLAPAEILGLGTRLGSIEKGKDGNLVVLTGDPLDSQSWVETVLIDGKVVYERSKDEKLKRILEVKK
jgi:imidazolonepropionase-like amidohydrolase